MKYLIAIGSNIRPRHHIPWALDRMCDVFASVRAGKFYRMRPMGMESRRLFWNGAVEIESPLGGADLKRLFVEWEESRGRDRGHAKCSLRDRPLDIDILWIEEDGWLIPKSRLVGLPYLFAPAASLMRGLTWRNDGTPVCFRVRGRLVGCRPVRLRP